MSNDEEPVGSLGEEAIKLLGAVQGWARENGQDATSAAAGAASVFQNLNEHIATGGADCRYCPLCQVISVVRNTSPEVKQHLSTAASSLLQAAAAAMSTDVSRRREESPVEKIDLSDESWDD